MTDVTVTIGGNVVSNYVIDVDIWMTKTTTIGVCELRLDNTADVWGNTFASNDVILISINAALMFAGLVDNVYPYLDERGVMTNELIVRGRDYGRYQTDYYLTKNYRSALLSADIIDDILSELGDPLGYAPPGGSPALKYNCQRTWLGDALREISQLVGYDYYIDTAGTLHFFLAGTIDSTVDLLCNPGGVTNNLLDFEEYEQIGFDIKNVIEVHAGSVRDHWTEENAADYGMIAGAGATSDETTVYMYGAASIKHVAAANDVTFGLDFSGTLYSHTSLDLSAFGQAKVVFRPESGSLGNFSFQPFLEDGTGKTITFTRDVWNKAGKGYTENINGALEKWHPLSYPIGDHYQNPIVATQRSGLWHGDTDFDWTDVDKMGFRLVTTANMDTVYVDAWAIPTVEARSIQTDAASVAAYGARMYTEFRKELHSQVELDAYCANVLAFRKDPIQKFKATATGQVLTKYVAQTVDVQAPDYGINALTPYIIVTLHHILHNDRNVRGWDFITKYELVASETDPTRVIRDNNYLEALLRQLRRENRGYKGAMTDDEYWIGDIHTGITNQIQRGAAFPTDMNDGDLFFLTADYNDGNQYYGPAQYKYDETLGVWIRDPIVMHRAANPPVGGEVTGDTLHRTDTGEWYRWSGAAWVLIVISGSSLKKGMQPFTSNIVFEPIRAYASVATTYDVDVDDGGGNAVITAAAGTPFSDFAAGDELLIQGCEDADNNSTARTVDSVGGGGASITLDNILAGGDVATDETIIISVMDAVKWTGDTPAVWYADGDTENINSGSGHGMPLLGNWIYLTVGNANLTVTNTYANAVGDDVAVVCRVEVTADKEPIIFPFNTRGENISVDGLAAGSVDTLVLTSDAIIGKDFRTAALVGEAGGPMGMRFDSLGMVGYSAGVTKTVEMDATTGYFIAYGNFGGGSVRFNVGAANYGWMTCFLDGADEVTEFRGDDQIWLNVGGDLIKIAAGGDIDVDADLTLDLVDADLIIPVYDGADPVAPREAQIWYRKN